jgi:exosortase family protein XrtF
MKEKLSEWLKSNGKPISFVLKMLGIYLSLQLFYDYVISPHTALDFWLINSIIDTAEFGLETLGYNLIPKNSLYQYHMGIEGTTGVVIGNPCDGLSLFILYSAFLLVFKGKWWVKLLFVALGIILIHFLNVIRVIGLALVVKYSPESLDFHHSYTFTLFVYLFIFLLWMLRIKFFQLKKI